MTTTPIDTPQRLQALDITQSFIVQAPAGSGKTELLTQRYLALLAKAQAPEEIIAITFTRKAANEMRLRILQALQEASETTVAPQNPHQQQRWQLAQAALQQDQQQQWYLLENPNRLRVQTIDSLCASITRQMPVLSRFGAQPAITDDAETLYRQAAEAVLNELESDQPWIPALCSLLTHLDNNHERVAGLFVDILKTRDQWLPHIFHSKNDREMLESGLQRVIDETVARLNKSLPATLWEEIGELFEFAAESHPHPSKANAFDDLSPQGRGEAAAELLLTTQNTWRKTVDKRNGFPAEAKTMKQRMLVLLEEMTAYETARECFIDIKQLPPKQYSDKQWQVLSALFTLLPILAAQLKLVFQQQGTVDHIEIAQSALLALGDPQHPTDLALALDYRIQHLLVDEFQDTSITQLRLLEQLTAGWQDDRTLFLVGDPMQSIYRFRKAEVGIFLQVRDQGIGHIQPTFLNLQVNFRSTAALVNWSNTVFQQMLPSQENISRGAITFSPSHANQTDADMQAVHTHWLVDADEVIEAQHIAEEITQILATQPDDKIAILVRARSHLREILLALRQRKIAYRAVEIDTLATRPVIQDLLALTRALLHPADRIAWLAILRAPWCGLDLADLHALTHNQNPLLENLQQYLTLNLSHDAKQRLARITPILTTALQQRARQPLRTWIKGTWLALGGPACLVTEDELHDSQTFFNLLDQFNTTTQDLNQLETQLACLYAEQPSTENSRVEVMTMHKAKGLEFDVVFLPGLGRAAAPESPKLLLLMERATLTGHTDLLFAPIKASDEIEDMIYQYLTSEDKRKSEYESMRLLYVAVTRAKKTLHLVGTVKQQKEKIQPTTNSLLAHLWPIISNENNLSSRLGSRDPVNMDVNPKSSKLLKRLTKNWQLPITLSPTTPPRPQPIEDLQAWETHPQTLQAIGTVVHLLLCKISRDGITQIHSDVIKNLLLQNSVTSQQIKHCVTQVEQALKQTLNSERGNWILQQDHQDAHSEYALTYLQNEQPKTIVIDRTFVDQKDIRWIIDYKTTQHAIEIENYREQLETYAQAMRLLETRKIYLGLYFPLLNEWREWEFIQ